MRKYIYPLVIFLFASKAFSHTSHYEGLKKIEMDVVRNGEVIGYTNYYFEKEDDIMTVKNYTKFKVKLMGVTIFSILSATFCAARRFPKVCEPCSKGLRNSPRDYALFQRSVNRFKLRPFPTV